MTDVTTLKPIDRLDHKNQRYSLCRDSLLQEYREMAAQLEAVKALFLPALKALAAKAGEARAELEKEIAAHPELFVKPRTMQLHGIKFGYQAVAETVAPGPNTIALIEKHLPEEQVELMIEVKKSVVKSTLKDLSPGDRQRLGCVLTPRTDRILIKPTGDALEAVIDKILDEAASDEGQH